MRRQIPQLPVGKNNLTAKSAAASERFPILHHSERSLSELRVRKSTSINHVLRVVERDPVLALELFVSANRELKRAAKPPATNIRRALLVFGLARYLEHSKFYETLEQHLPSQLLRPMLNHLGRSYFAAKLAERLAQLRGHVYVEDAFCFGLMCDIDKYMAKLVSATTHTADPANLRTLLPGLATPLITSNPLHWCADTGAKFANATQFMWDPAKYSPLVEHIGETLGIDSYDVESEITTTAVAAALNSKHFNDFPAARNLLNPGPQKTLVALLFPEQRPAKKTPTAVREKLPNKARSRKTISHTTKAVQNKTCLIDKKDLIALKSSIDKATRDLKILGSTKPTRTRILPFSLNVITSVLKANKTYFIANASSSQLVVRLRSATGEKPKTANIELLADDNLVLKKGMASGKPLHINPRQLKTHRDLFEPKLTKVLNGHEVYSIPLKTKNKVIGIMLAQFDCDTTDNWPMHFQLCCLLAESTVNALSTPNG